jgi:hypothetical protein
LDLADPAVQTSFLDSILQIVDDLDQSRPGSGVSWFSRRPTPRQCGA